MSSQPAHKRPRRSATVVVLGLLAAAVAVLVVVGVTDAASAPPAARPSTTAPAPAASRSPSVTSEPTRTPTPAPRPSKTTEPSRAAAAKPTPQPTKTAAITQSTPAAIKKELSVRVVDMEAVTGTAQGPGEVAGPSVRFTIRITNTTGAPVKLSNTVINAYVGEDRSPAVQLQSPGARNFPISVADGASATGAFVFNIPKAERDRVQVTVDTSVNNPVIAFEGAAPKS
ncbi:hypothetical protein GCM10025783_28260 [Amnibacterium soli]|uniref:DUF4352 domain-containing protein n=1 Tax=Amnibacterium soli TaxID=1282736 RepID=A0ABP8ZDQ4_9MICO